jgi:hypothetical protein
LPFARLRSIFSMGAADDEGSNSAAMPEIPPCRVAGVGTISRLAGGFHER